MAAVRSRQIVRNGLGGEEERRHSQHVFSFLLFVHWMRERERERRRREFFANLSKNEVANGKTPGADGILGENPAQPAKRKRKTKVGDEAKARGTC